MNLQHWVGALGRGHNETQSQETVEKKEITLTLFQQIYATSHEILSFQTVINTTAAISGQERHPLILREEKPNKVDYEGPC